MSNRTAAILAVAAVISSLGLYAAFAQDRPQAPQPEDGAIVVGPPPVRLQQELPRRYHLSAVSRSSGNVDVVVLDTHTGQCWYRDQRSNKWRDWGSPANRE